MKRIWSKKAKEAVSPVIATILMVAITVVLAAVLYVMVMQYIQDPNDGPKAGSINRIVVTNNSTAKIEFGAFTGKAVPMSMKLIIEASNGDSVTLTWPSAPTSGNFPLTSDNAAVSGIYKDLVPEGNTIDSGDSVVVSGLTPGRSYEIILVSGDSKIELSGTKTFYLNP